MFDTFLKLFTNLLNEKELINILYEYYICSCYYNITYSCILKYEQEFDNLISCDYHDYIQMRNSELTNIKYYDKHTMPRIKFDTEHDVYMLYIYLYCEENVNIIIQLFAQIIDEITHFQLQLILKNITCELNKI